MFVSRLHTISYTLYDLATKASASSTRRFTLAEIRLIEMSPNGYSLIKDGDYALFVPNELLDTYNDFLPPELRLP